MIVERLDSIESNFRANGDNRRFFINPFSLAIPGETKLRLEACTLRPSNGFEGYFYRRTYEKTKIVLHFTIGNIRSDAVALTTNEVSVPFLIARDGTIYNLFASKYWSFHLGRGAVGGNTENSQCSVAIELSNYGPLTRVGDNLETYYSRLPLGNGRNNPPQLYCSVNDKEHYYELSEPYRGYRYFAAYTNAQYESLIVLLRYLTAVFDIPREFLPEDIRYVATRETADFKGIVSHVNFQGAGKVDMPPAFDWNKVIKGVQARIYGELTPVEKAELELEDSKKAVDEAYTKLNHLRKQVSLAEDALSAATSALKAAEEQIEMLKSAEKEARLKLEAAREGRDYVPPGNNTIIGTEVRNAEVPFGFIEEEDSDTDPDDDENP